MGRAGHGVHGPQRICAVVEASIAEYLYRGVHIAGEALIQPGGCRQGAFAHSLVEQQVGGLVDYQTPVHPQAKE